MLPLFLAAQVCLSTQHKMTCLPHGSLQDIAKIQLDIHIDPIMAPPYLTNLKETQNLTINTSAWYPSISRHTYGCLQYSSHLSCRGSSLDSIAQTCLKSNEPAIRYGQVRNHRGGGGQIIKPKYFSRRHRVPKAHTSRKSLPIVKFY